MTRLLPDPPSRSGGILQRRELDAALRVLEALRSPREASIVLSWDNDMQDALAGLSRAGYVETIPAYGGRAPRKASAPFRSDRLATTDLGREYLISIRSASHATKRGVHKEVRCRKCKGTGYIYTTRQEACPSCDKLGKVRARKASPAQLQREIDAMLATKRAPVAHATRAVRPTPYRIKLTPSEMRAVEFARGRYAWPDMLAVHTAEDGSIAFTESEMWQWTDDVDSDTEGGHSPFPLAAEAFADKLQRFYDSRV